MQAEMKLLTAGGIGLVSLATIVIAGIAVLTQFKGTGLVDNTTADAFITGLGYFGAFAGVMVLVSMATVIYKMIGKNMKS